MKSQHRFASIAASCRRASGQFAGCFRALGPLRAHSSLCPLEESAPRHPQIAQGEQRVQLRRVLGQSSVAHLDVTELSLDDPKRVLDLRSHAGLQMLDSVEQRAHCAGRVQRPSLAGAHGHVPASLDALGFLAFGHTLVARIREDVDFFTMHLGLSGLLQGMQLGQELDEPTVGNDALLARRGERIDRGGLQRR